MRALTGGVLLAASVMFLLPAAAYTSRTMEMTCRQPGGEGMTDLVTRPGTEEAPTDETVSATAHRSHCPDRRQPASAPPLAWAPTEPAPRKRHLALWLGIPAGIAVVALVASSLVLIAPGTSVAGVPVGGLTPGAAADAVQKQLAETTVVLVGAEGDPEITGAELGAFLDARALADRAFSRAPDVEHHDLVRRSHQRGRADRRGCRHRRSARHSPRSFRRTGRRDDRLRRRRPRASPSPRTCPGSGVDVEAVRLALQAALADGETRVEVDATPVELPAVTSTATADASVASLNGMLDTAGFYVGAERTVPIDRAVVASWLSVQPSGDGAFEITADAAAIQPMVDGLAPLVNRGAENGNVITDSAGDVLREDAAGISGRELGDTSTVAPDFAAQLSTGNGAFALPVTEVAPVITTLAPPHRGQPRRAAHVPVRERAGRAVVVHLVGNGRVQLRAPGGFRISAKLDSQNMGNRDLTKAPNYYTQNVPWVMYYNGDEALHGAYWHNNFGNRMSHGCVNMPVDAAAFVYSWAPMGTEVSVHA